MKEYYWEKPLTNRERQVLLMFLKAWITGKGYLTLQQVAYDLDITQERVRQLRARATRKVLFLLGELGE